MKLFKFILLALVASFTFSCSSDDSEPTTPQVTIADFEGSWKASSAVFTNNSNASESVDFIAVGGEIRYTMLPAGKTRIWIELENNPVDEFDAVVTLGTNNTYTSTPVETSRSVENGTYVLGNNTITLTSNNASFDFTNSGTEVPATSVIKYAPNN